jgi:hypothetical protein
MSHSKTSFVSRYNTVLTTVFSKPIEDQPEQYENIIEGLPYIYVHHEPIMFSYVKREDHQNITQYMNPSLWVVMLNVMIPEVKSLTKQERLISLQNMIKTFFAHIDDVYMNYKAYGIKKVELMKLFQTNMNHPIFKNGLSQLFNYNILIWDENNALVEHYPDHLCLTNDTICFKVNKMNNYQQIIIDGLELESLRIPTII